MEKVANIFWFRIDILGQPPTGQSLEAEIQALWRTFSNIQPGDTLLTIFAEVGDTTVQLPTAYLHGNSGSKYKGSSVRKKVLLHVKNCSEIW